MNEENAESQEKLLSLNIEKEAKNNHEIITTNQDNNIDTSIPREENENLSKLSQTTEILEEEDDIETFEDWQQKSCMSKCCFYLWCCCLCHSKQKSKNYYKKNWQKYLSKEGNDSADLPFKKLTNLFANADDAIEGLQDFRLNPNLVSEHKLRNDLEFYIPQLCTFLLFGDVKAIEEFFVFLCKVCNASFFFAHRVHWFLSAMINAAQEKKEDIINILKMVNTLFKSENKAKKNKIGNFYIANSSYYMKYIKKSELYFLYDTKTSDEEETNYLETIDYNKLSGYQQEILNKYRRSRKIINEYSNKEYIKAKKKEENKINIKNTKTLKEEENKPENNSLIDFGIRDVMTYKFKANEFLIDLSNFKVDHEELFEGNEDEILDNEIEIEQVNDFNVINKTDILKNIPDINYISYYSTINFIEHLCSISNELPNHPIEEQMLFLYEKISEINKKLPCNVYLPFLKDSTRNYFICHIPLNGARIFRTKTRCPLMLTFEIIRMDEVNSDIKDEQENGVNINMERTKSVSSYSLKDSFQTNDQNKVMLKDKIVDDLFEEEKNDYIGTDYDLSKPLVLNKTNKSNKNNNVFSKEKINDLDSNEININTSKTEKNVRKNSEDEESQKIKNIIKKFRLNDMNNNTLRTPYSKTIFESKKTTNNLNVDNDINSDTNKKNQRFTQNRITQAIADTDNQIKEEEKKKDEKIQTINKNINMEELKNVFGESFAKKGKNIKKTSLFGSLNSHKIFRCIIKTHEDLRQEQFATQLINEFYQIFKIENVDCWLNTYEIISTGNDSGLVEMVNDSLSLDQLKQKINHISLADFYLHYFGNGNKESVAYKKAMKNFVSSLAGYSLVCYFLQIKDRHNGNILIDNKGHLIHIDFGFLLSNAPGKGLKFESAPFKLSNDMVACLGGTNGHYFEEFRKLLQKGFSAIYKHKDKIIILVEMMWCGHGKNLDCFEKGQETINELKTRLSPKEGLKKKEIHRLVDDLIRLSVDNWRTNWYDIFQYHFQGIFY